MRTQLPDTFAELTFVVMNDDSIEETKEKVLILEMDRHSVTYINIAGATVSSDMYCDIIDGRKRVAHMKFLSDESDEYFEFTQTVQHADMIKALEQLGSYVEKEFQKIINVCPEDHNTLYDQLKTHVVPEK